MKKIVFSIFMSIAFIFLLGVNVKAETTLCPGAKSAVLIESKTGTILFEKNKDEKRSCASMTKIMTLLLIYDALASGKINKNDLVVGSENAKSMGGSQVYLEVGEKLTVDDMLKCICIASANDCAVAMAEHIYGTEEKFVEKMNEKAKELGCNNTHFNDTTGLSENEHYSSSYDMALISKELINKYPDVLTYTSIKEDYIRKDTDNPFWLVNTNKILGHLEGLKGLKTGFTSKAMYCITLVMEKDNMELISVVMGYDSSQTRNAESVSLLKYGFANYERLKIIDKGTVYDKIESIKYTPTINYVISKDDIYILKAKGKDIDYQIDFDYLLNETTLNESIGTVYIKDLEGNLLASGDLILKEKSKSNNFFQIILIVLEKLFK